MSAKRVRQHVRAAPANVETRAIEPDVLRAILDHVAVGIAVLDTSGTVVSLNEEAVRLLGGGTALPATVADCARSFELRRPDGAVIPIADWPASRALRGDYVRDLDVELIGKATGDRRLVRISVAPLPDAAGGVSRLVCQFVDRTEHEGAARALRVVEGRFRGVVDHAPTGVAIATRDGRVEECNLAFCRIVGYDQDELRTMTFSALAHPDDRDANMQQIGRLRSGEIPSVEIENRCVRRDGATIWVHKHVSVVPDTTGRPDYLMALISDVTERRQADERRRWEEARNALLLRLLDGRQSIAGGAPLMAAAAEGLGRLLGVSRVGFYRVEGDSLTRTVCWTDGTLPALAGPIRVATIGDVLQARNRAGLPTAIDDVRRFQWTAETVPGLEGVGAVVVAPVRRASGEWYGGVYVHAIGVRGWAEHEIALISEVAYETWEGIERRQAQAELQLALAASAAGTWSLDLDSRMVTWDDRSRALFGFPPGAAVTFEEMAARLDDDDRVHVTARLEALHTNAGLDEWDMEFRVRRPDGTLVWVHSLGRAERDASGRVHRLSGINLDVTARKQAEAALREVRDEQRENTETMRMLLEGAAQGILSVDAAGIIVTANATLEAMFGWAPGALIGERLEVLLPPAARARHVDHQAGYLAAPRSRPMGVGMNLLGQRRDGRTFPVEISLNHAATAQGGRTIAFVTDITQRQLASERLRDSEQRLRLALDAAAAGAWSWDVERDLVAADARTCARLGLPPDEAFPSVRFRADVHPDDRARLAAALDGVRARAGLPGWDVEYRRLGVAGGVTWHQSIGRAERDADGRAIRVSGISLDVTARKAAEAEVARSHAALRTYAGELEAKTTQLRRLASDLTLVEQRARERLAKTLHDDLQQLLFGATLKIDRAARGKGEPDLLMRARGDIQEAIAAARSLSVELFPPALRRGGLPAALEWLAGWTQEKYGISVQVSTDPRADPVHEDVRLVLFESVRELLFNAVKHAEVDEIELSLTLDGADRVTIRVADTGVGFDPAAVFGGNGPWLGGLGLFGIRERLTVFGGLLEVESAPSRGARFLLTVSRASGAPGGRPEERTAEGPAGVPMPRVRVLLADDHAVVREGLRELLSEWPRLEVVGEASDGLEAVEQARRLRPDVVVMDVSMPRLDGIEATRRIRAELPDVEVFGLSTQEPSDGLHEIVAAGAAAYFTKSDGTERLIARLIALPPRQADGRG